MSQQINLINPAFAKQSKHFSLPAMLQGLGLIAAGSLIFYSYAVYQVDRLGKQSEESAKRYKTEQARLVRYAAEFSPQQANQALQDEVRRLEKRAADQAELIEIIKSGAVGNTTGYSEYMRAFSRQVVQGLWMTGFRVTGDAAQVSLSGAVLAPELLPAYIQRLNKESVMRGRTFATLQMRLPRVDTTHGVDTTQGIDARQGIGAGRAGGASQGTAPRYVEFTLHSGTDGEVKK